MAYKWLMTMNITSDVEGLSSIGYEFEIFMVVKYNIRFGGLRKRFGKVIMKGLFIITNWLFMFDQWVIMMQ